MLNEFKILINNIKNFRKLKLNEAVSDSSIRDAIEEHKIVIIYYDGDDKLQKGHRTIRPFVLGTHKQSGNKVVRAWQDAGSSASYRNIPTSSRWGHRYQKGHEYFDNPQKGGIQPGWRLFRVDKISTLLPTGEVYDPKKYFNVSGVKYRPDDSEINVEIAIQKDVDGGVKVSGTDSIDDPNSVEKQISKDVFKTQTSKFKQFYNLTKKRREITKNEIKDLWNLVKRYRKKSPRKYWVAQNEKGDMVLVTDKAVERGDVPDEAIVGNLSKLYDKHIASKETLPSSDFYNQVKKDIINRRKK